LGLDAAVALACGHIVLPVLVTVAFGFACFAWLLLIVQVRRVVGAVGALLGNVILLAFLMTVRLEIVGAYFFVHVLKFRNRNVAKMAPPQKFAKEFKKVDGSSVERSMRF
jgi:hypothetical protein